MEVSWSEPRAFVGVMYSAQAVGSFSNVVITGSWYASDLPEEVPVAKTTCSPFHARCAASA